MSKNNIRLEPLVDEKYEEIFNTQWLPKIAQMITGSDWTEKHRKKKYGYFLKDSELAPDSHDSIMSFIVYADNNPVGYVQSYDAYGPSWKVPLDNLPKPLTTFEICVWEEEYLSKGISDHILHLLLSKDILGNRNLLLCTDVENTEAIKLLELSTSIGSTSHISSSPP